MPYKDPEKKREIDRRYRERKRAEKMELAAKLTKNLQKQEEEKPKKRGCTPGGERYTFRTNDPRTRAIAKLGNDVQAARREMRKKLLQSAIEVGIDNFFVDSIKKRDKDGISVVATALKLVGLDYESSPEAVKNLNLKAESTSKSDTTIKFVIEDA